MCSPSVKDVFSVALEDFCCDSKSRHLRGFDWGSLQLLLCVIGITRRADLGGRVQAGWVDGERGGRWGKSRSKHDNLRVSQFQEAGWPDTLGKHPRAAETRAEQGRAVQEEDESSLITKGSNCPPQPRTPTLELNSNYGENTVHCHPILSC